MRPRGSHIQRPPPLEPNQKTEIPVAVHSDILLDNVESFMHAQAMIDRDSRIKGLNMDYRPTSRYCHRTIITVLF